MKWNQERMQELRVREINLSLPKGNVEGSLTEGEGKGGEWEDYRGKNPVEGYVEGSKEAV